MYLLAVIDSIIVALSVRIYAQQLDWCNWRVRLFECQRLIYNLYSPCGEIMEDLRCAKTISQIERHVDLRHVDDQSARHVDQPC